MAVAHIGQGELGLHMGGVDTGLLLQQIEIVADAAAGEKHGLGVHLDDRPVA